jgi:glycogen debranching enzyme
MNGDGYIDYEKRSAKGLVNQGWKDSQDGIVHADGRLVEPPVALVEVQGYVHAALLLLAPVFEALGDGDTASALRERATLLKERFNQDFHVGDGLYALALDGSGAAAAAVTSNPGHALWTGIVAESHAPAAVRRLMQPDMFSGWGVRTLSSASPAFNPQGYHLGSIWPHDNSVVAMGFKRSGCEGELNTLATALFDAAQAFPYYRLPELFGGSERTAHRQPVPYPVACRPQSWAAGAFPLITQALLGLCPDAPGHRLSIVRPVLPPWLRHVRVCNLRVGAAEADLRYDRYGERTDVQILGVRGRLDVQVVDRWPG